MLPSQRAASNDDRGASGGRSSSQSIAIMTSGTTIDSPVPAVPSPSLTARSIPTSVRGQHAIVRERTIQARRSAIERIVFWTYLTSSAIQLLVIATVMALYVPVYAPGNVWRLSGIGLLAYGITLIPKNVCMIYFYLHPLRYDDFNIPMPPEDPMGKFMFRLGNAADMALFIAMLLLAVASLDQDSHKAAPAIYWTALAIFLFNLGVALLPWLGLLLLICCLPCVIQLLRWMYPEPNRGASEDDIKSIPKYPYSSGQRTYGGATIEPEDASCVICLQEYSDGVDIRVLHCNHHYHQRCADEWFRFQATCPLCVAPATGESQGDDSKV